MPITEVPSSPPPNAEQTPDSGSGLPPRRGGSDYEDLGTDELVQRISELEDERRAARIREGIWIALLFHSIVVLFWIFGPRYILREPQVVTPKLNKDQMLTYVPPRSTPHPSAPVHPSIDNKTLQRLRAATRASAPPDTRSLLRSRPRSSRSLPRSPRPSRSSRRNRSRHHHRSNRSRRPRPSRSRVSSCPPRRRSRSRLRRRRTRSRPLRPRAT